MCCCCACKQQGDTAVHQSSGRQGEFPEPVKSRPLCIHAKSLVPVALATRTPKDQCDASIYASALGFDIWTHWPWNVAGYSGILLLLPVK